MLDDSLKRLPNKTVGMKQTKRALEKGQVVKLYVAKDAEAHIVRPLIQAAEEQHLEIIEVPTMAELGRACGIDVGAAVVGILK